jgi:predicted esterase
MQRHLPLAWLSFSLTLFSFAGIAAAQDQDDLADVPAEDLRAGGNDRQRYFLIAGPEDNAAAKPKGGYGLLLVLPGGDGNADMHPFIKRMYKHALDGPDRNPYLVAQLVAVPSDDPEQVVWPTARWKHKKQTFTTEQFIRNVIRDVKAKHPIDAQRVYVLAWSSGGPASYSEMLAKDTQLKGAFIAMAVYLPQRLPPVAAAKGRKFYLLQSPEDEVTRHHFAVQAREALTKAGAKVKLKEYEGGHGWPPKVYDEIRDGIAWLEAGR